MLTLHSLFNDNAVLQCEKPVSIRGTATPRAGIALHFAGLDQQIVAGNDGRWTIVLPALPAGGPHELVLESGDETLRHSGIMLGEVWLCAGQSNMEWTLGMLEGAERDIAEANDPLLRCFTVARLPANEPAASLTGCWQMATPQLARDFSATAYFFGRCLRAATGRSVGLVVSAFGGTVIASWLPKTVLKSRPEYRTFLSENSTSREKAFIPHSYESRTPVATGWETVDLDETDWKTLPVPGYWQNHGWSHNGAVWYRRSMELPPHWRGREMTLELGACDDFDDTFVNGTRVGGIGPEAPSAYATRRVYVLPALLTATDRLTIAIRVFDHWGNGGIMGDSLLRCAEAPEETFSIAGNWKAKVEKALPLRAPGSGVPPTLLYQGMIHPLVGFAVRGFLWYQGESDLAQAALYRRLLPDLIGAWRSLWGDPLLPFGIVQIANYQARSPRPGEDERAELRDAQLLAAQTVPATGLAVTIDVGESDNIHPRQKRPVGERLARWALAEVYGRPELPWSSPLPADHWTETPAIHVRFSHAGNGLRPRGGAPLQGFQIAGSDRQWRWAEAIVIQADTVRVSARIVKEPVAVRYAWQSNPLCTLENSAGLPASPFRTDDWPLVTSH